MGRKYDDVEPEQGRVLEEIEKMLGKEIKRQKKILWETSGYRSEEKKVVELNLNFKDLKTLPESIGQLDSLVTLFLQNNQLINIPESIGNLTALQHLALTENKLKILPESIGNLRVLKELWISNNLLKSLPESIEKLIILEDINVEHNQLKELPGSIGKLSMLRLFDASHNQLIHIPDSIGKLKSLIFLDLGHNKLELIPESIGSLKSLEKLDLSHNHLKALPGSIGTLKLLKIFDIQHNMLRTLPGSLWRLANLQDLQIKGNPLGHEWESIKKKGLDAILEHCRKIGSVNVFFSYAMADYESRKYPIAELSDNIQSRDEISHSYHCMQDMKKDGNIDKFMNETVPQCQVLIFAATKKSLQSKDCQHELSLANTHNIKIIPILGDDLTWEDPELKHSGLNREIGLNFANYDVPKLGDEIYNYLSEYKRKHDLFAKKEAELKIELSNIKHTLTNFLVSPEFEKVLKRNLPQFKELFQDLCANKITPKRYFLKFVDFLSTAKSTATRSSKESTKKKAIKKPTKRKSTEENAEESESA
jgi:hypothetical protein